LNIEIDKGKVETIYISDFIINKKKIKQLHYKKIK